MTARAGATGPPSSSRRERAGERPDRPRARDLPAPRLPELHPLSFSLPPELEAPAPPEYRGITRDAVRMLVATRSDGALVHSHFSELPRFLDEGDLVVINTSGTLAAEIDGTAPDGTATQVHLSSRLPAGLWTVEVRREGDAYLGASPGDVIALAGRRRTSRCWPRTPPGRPASACGSGSRGSRRPSVCTASWPATAGPSATATCRATTRSPPTRTSTPPSPGLPRCRARDGPSRPRC